MAKAESGLRSRIKKALEADGWSVITQHGSAYNPNVLDLTVVLACLEVKTDSGAPRPGQRNTIRRLRKQGIPAGIVRSIEEARQGMALVRQGVRQVANGPEIDLSYLNSLLAGNSATATVATGPSLTMEPPAVESEAPSQLTELLGMQGQFETFEATPAPEEPEPGTPDLNHPQARLLVDAYQSVLKQAEETANVEQVQVRAVMEVPQQYQAVPAAGLGVLEQIVGYLAHIDELLTGLVAGFGGEQPSASDGPTQPGAAAKRRRRTRAQIEADEAAAAGEQPDPVE